MDSGERTRYEGKYGRPPPIDTSAEATEKRLKKQGLWKKKPKTKPIDPNGWIKALRRYIMKDKAPKVVEPKKETYICPNSQCLKDSLMYDNEERFFICKECGHIFALIDVTEEVKK